MSQPLGYVTICRRPTLRLCQDLRDTKYLQVGSPSPSWDDNGQMTSWGKRSMLDSSKSWESLLGVAHHAVVVLCGRVALAVLALCNSCSRCEPYDWDLITQAGDQLVLLSLEHHLNQGMLPGALDDLGQSAIQATLGTGPWYLSRGVGGTCIYLSAGDYNDCGYKVYRTIVVQVHTGSEHLAGPIETLESIGEVNRCREIVRNLYFQANGVPLDKIDPGILDAALDGLDWALHPPGRWRLLDPYSLSVAMEGGDSLVIRDLGWRLDR